MQEHVKQDFTFWMTVMLPAIAELESTGWKICTERSSLCRLIRRRLVMSLVREERPLMHIIEQTGVKIDITDEGSVSICGSRCRYDGIVLQN